MLKSVVRRAGRGDPYGVSPERAAAIMAECDGIPVDLGPLVQDFLRCHAAATRPRRSAGREHPGTCMPVVDVLVHLMWLCRDILRHPLDGFRVEGSRITAPTRVWAERLGVSVRTLEHLRTRLAEAFARTGRNLPPIFAAWRGCCGGLTVDAAALAGAHLWLDGAPALRLLARGSLAVLRVMAGVEKMLACARRIMDAGLPPMEILEQITAAAIRPRIPPRRLSANSTGSKDRMDGPRGRTRIRRISHRDVRAVREGSYLTHPLLIPNRVPHAVPARASSSADPAPPLPLRHEDPVDRSSHRLSRPCGTLSSGPPKIFASVRDGRPDASLAHGTGDDGCHRTDGTVGPHVDLAPARRSPPRPFRRRLNERVGVGVAENVSYSRRGRCLHDFTDMPSAFPARRSDTDGPVRDPPHRDRSFRPIVRDPSGPCDASGDDVSAATVCARARVVSPDDDRERDRCDDGVPSAGGASPVRQDAGCGATVGSGPPARDGRTSVESVDGDPTRGCDGPRCPGHP